MKKTRLKMMLFFKHPWKMSKSVPNSIILPWFYTYIKSMLLSKAYMNIPDFSPDLELFIQRKKRICFFITDFLPPKKNKSRKKATFYGCLWSSVRPKPGFGIGNRNQSPISVSVLEPKLFFPKPKLFFQKISNFSHVFLLIDF